MGLIREKKNPEQKMGSAKERTIYAWLKLILQIKNTGGSPVQRKTDCLFSKELTACYSFLQVLTKRENIIITMSGKMPVVSACHF